MSKKKILITGGAGFLGSHLCEKILKNDKSISVDTTITWIFSFTIFERSLTGKKPPDEINVNARLGELNDLIEKKFRTIKTKRVKIEYIK